MKVHQLPVDAFLTALKFMGVEDIDSDEVQCILANLIFSVSIDIMSLFSNVILCSGSLLHINSFDSDRIHYVLELTDL